MRFRGTPLLLRYELELTNTIQIPLKESNKVDPGDGSDLTLVTLVVPVAFCEGHKFCTVMKK